MYQNLTILAAIVFVYSLAAGRLERTVIGGPILFTAVGLAIGPLGLDWVVLNIDADGLSTLAELTLALVLFTDASNARLRVLEKSIRIPQRLLLGGLPLTILLGFGVAVFLFESLTLFECAILATMLAPTDAALGKAVVTNKSVPVEIREGLNVESGLNDGICVPILLLFIALATGSARESGLHVLALELVTGAIGIGLAVGLVLAFVGAMLIEWCSKQGWVTDTWQQLPVVALSIACFALSEWLGGSGFIAAFAGGLLFGGLAKKHKHRLLLAAEGTGDTLALITWVVFGAAVAGQALGSFTWEILLYAVLSLSVVRMLPVFLALSSFKLRTDEKLFMGWFGPRGLASIVFAVIVLREHLPNDELISTTVACTILLSIVAHGLSANPLVAALAQRSGSSKENTAAGA